jgi:hypothetical protein
MEKITSSKDLHAAIFSLQQKKDELRMAIENDMQNIHESFTLKHVFKTTLNSITHGESVKTKAASSALGIGVGFIAQKIVGGRSKNIFMKLLASIVQIAVTGLVAKNSNKLASKSVELGKKLFR